MRNYALLVFAVCSISGCVPPQLLDTLDDIPAQVDLSTGGSTSVIEGTTAGVIDREYCFISSPARTFELTTNSGATSIVVECFTYDTVNYTGRRSNSASISFEAQADHRYSLVWNRGGGINDVDLVDLTEDGRLIVREPFLD